MHTTAAPEAGSARRRAASWPWRGALVVFVGVVVVSGAFRLVLPGDLGANESTDLTTFYRPVAERLLDGDGLTTPDGAAALRYPPGYPVLLAAAFGPADALGVAHDTAATTLGLVAAGGAGVVLWALARRTFDTTVAGVAVALWSLHPVHLWLTKQPNSELPYELFLFASVLACTPTLQGRGTWRSTALAGALLGAATLVRPAGLALVVPLVVVLAVVDRGRPATVRAGSAGAALAAFVLVLAPWSAWASSQAGHPVLVADAVTVNVVEGLTLGADGPDEAGRVAAPDGARSLAIEAWRQQDRLQDGDELVGFLGDQLAERPGAVAQLVVVKAARSWYGTDTGRAEPLLAVGQAALLVAVAGGGWVAWRRGPTARRYVLLASGLVVASWATAVAVDSLLRHLVPASGLLFPLLAAGLVHVARKAPRATTSHT